MKGTDKLNLTEDDGNKLNSITKLWFCSPTTRELVHSQVLHVNQEVF
jgi:hypothetical protein